MPKGTTKFKEEKVIVQVFENDMFRMNGCLITVSSYLKKDADYEYLKLSPE